MANFSMSNYFLLAVAALLVTQAISQRRFNNANYQQQQQKQQQNFYNNPSPNTVSNVHCPEANGTFATSTCDGYIECKDGVGEEKLCADGLLFNPDVRGFPCQYPIDVDCTGRTGTQPPQATEECPHQYGYFALGDATHCGQFKNCAAGRGYTFDCPEGLAFNSQSYRCDWPDQVPDCDAEAFLGFSCPPVAKGFLSEEYRYFRSPNDCQRYFVCVSGKPRMYNCGEGLAYNELSRECDGIENVTGCAPAYNANYDQQLKKQQQQPLQQHKPQVFRG
ncbi:PREDICTED: chondroitin proteoglycan 2-like [Nicrophorus vespilloides]|uniref:Chondroitin proteoglycan 2-like n=1 Tax=Nicrophorus vespilloides TaxID=110193 RepID=A0ABM1MJR4_NICVS|nr:PREDICTED: chondroitin proteoglycan 2-like [Nicrophorus vespilloides]